MSIKTVTAHCGNDVEPHSLHPGSLAAWRQVGSPMNTTCPVCGDEIVETHGAVLHGDADYPFDPQYFTHPECDSVTIGEAL